MSSINDELIKRYQNDKVIIKTYYSDSKGINIDGVVNPLRIDNRQLMAPTDNQSRYPACAGYSACTLIESLYWKMSGKLIQLDSKQVYAKAKELDGEKDMEGTYLETSLQAALSLCDFDFLKNARIEIFSNGKDLDTIEKTKFLIHKYGFLQAGFQIDESWYSMNSYNYVISRGGRPLGGHAVNLAGYDSEGVYIQNQWGSTWGAKGFAMMHWDLYLSELMYGTYISGIQY